MSVIADKRYKVDGYLAKGIIGAADCVIIAVNICRLSDLDPDGNGITRMPLSMEAVFPIGPLVVPISSDGKIDGPMQNAPRFAVRKASGEPIKTTAFLDPAFVNISAVIQAHQKDMHERDLVLATIHNPLALNPLPTGLLGAQKEFVALAHGDDYQLRDVRLEARLQELTESLTRRFLAREESHCTAGHGSRGLATSSASGTSARRTSITGVSSASTSSMCRSRLADFGRLRSRQAFCRRHWWRRTGRCHADARRRRPA